MSAIFYKNQLYGGGGGGSGTAKQTIPYKCLTPAQYQSLSNSQKTNGVMYFVFDNAQGEEGVYLSFKNVTDSEYQNLQPQSGVLYFVSNNSNGTFGINHYISNEIAEIDNIPCWIGG